ncbi:MAG: hypothetical protein EP334_03395 [Gammaproteobacteria bacterium]|nr:MAG: hypothetical protein EP334_03395 [Gammaproteobacteria bacterium]
MKKLLLLPFLTLLALPLAAEQVVVPVGQQAAEKQALQRPTRGISKAQVKEQFGEPLSEHAAVGEPPISSWEYADFVVYFEHDLVLHSVLKRDQKSAE